jgi:hypothetical protein
MLALQHCVHGNVGMACPVGADVYKVNIGLFAQTLPPFAVAICGGHLPALFRYDAFGIVNVLLYKVTQRCYAATFDMQHAVYSTLGTHAKAYEAYAYAVQRLAPQLQCTAV